MDVHILLLDINIWKSCLDKISNTLKQALLSLEAFNQTNLLPQLCSVVNVKTSFLSSNHSAIPPPKVVSTFSNRNLHNISFVFHKETNSAENLQGLFETASALSCPLFLLYLDCLGAIRLDRQKDISCNLWQLCLIDTTQCELIWRI